MSALLNPLALISVVWRRLISHLSLLLAVWAGCTLAVALVTSIPMFAEAAGYRILLASLEETGARENIPPFSMVYTYGGARVPPINWEQFRQADALAADLASIGIDLPTDRSVRYAATERLRVLFGEEQAELLRARFAFVTGIEDHIELVEGELPNPEPQDGLIEILVAETTANKLTLLVDDVYRLHSPPGQPDLNLPVRVAGIWRPIDPDGEFWFYPPSVFSETFIASPGAFAATVGGSNVPWIHYAAWYTALDGGSVRSADVPRLTNQINAATEAIQRTLQGTELTKSPSEALQRHRDQVRILTITLVLFSLPLLGLIGYFLVQVTGMVVQRQQQEIAILRSRGSSRTQVLVLTLLEGLMLGGAALLVGIPLGQGIAQLMTWTQSFLRFAPLPGPPVEILPSSWQHGVLVMLLILPAVLLPALRASRYTIVSFKQERARSMHKPVWQRLFLDVLLLIPALYGYQQLRLHGMINIPGVAAPVDDPYRNPLLLLTPMLLACALALLVLRFVPHILRLLAWLLSRAPGVALLMALRFLSRTTQAYSGPMLLLMLTLSLAALTSSMARTLDHHSFSRARYGAGADVRIVYIEKLPPSETGAPVAGAQQPVNSTDYVYAPVDDYLSIPGVQAVTRVATSSVFVGPSTGSKVRGVFVGVDRATLPAVIADSWRSDYATESLGALMNRLAADPSAVIVSANYAASRGIKVGDRLVADMNDLAETREVPFNVVGMVDYFPTLYPEEQPFIIGNLDYSFEEQGGPYPFEIWLDITSDANMDDIKGAAWRYGLDVSTETPSALLDTDRLRPERQGLFGLLSVGFLAAALVTVIGFLTYTLLSFQRRLVELGTLRAIGLGSRQLATLLISEQALVVGVGTAVGTGLGVLISQLFVPVLQVRTGEYPDTPPFVVQIAWDQIALVYLVAGLWLMLTIAMTLWLLRRMRIFEAVKLGEAV